MMQNRCLVAIQVFFLLTVWSVAYSSGTNPQDKDLVTLDKRNISFAEVFQTIRKQTGLTVFYSNELFNDQEKLDVSFQRAEVSEVMNYVLKEKGLEWSIRDRYIVLRKADSPPEKKEGSGSRQETAPVAAELSGKVVDSISGEPLPGVSVQVKGISQGVSTDTEGRFRLEVEGDEAVLVFSLLGYRSKEVRMKSAQVVTVKLSLDKESLEEVVVIGYGTQRKSDLTGSVASVDNDDLNKGAISSVDQALQGKVAGVQITQNSSEPGGGMSIRIRGASSINAGNEPLYVIDGFPIDNSSMLSSTGTGGAVAHVARNPNPKNPLNALNPNDIESIEILKDASATAIYGSRGANGVVLITTKKGSAGVVRLQYDGYSGVQTLAKEIDILSTGGYVEAMNALSVERGGEPVFTQEDIAAIGTGTNWQDEIFQSAPVHNHSLSLSGGVENTRYFISGNFFDQGGIVRNTGMKKYIARVNIEQDIQDKVTVGLNLNTSFVKDRNSVDGINTNEQAGPVNTALLFDPTLPVKNEDGSFVRSTELTINNPVGILEGISSIGETNRTFGNLFIDYAITDGLSTKLNFGSERQTARRDLYNSRKTIHGRANGGIADIRSLERSNVLLEYTLSYSGQLNENHTINALAGVTYQDFIDRSYSSTISGFPSDLLGTDNLNLGDSELAAVGSSKAGYTLLSYLGRVNYSMFNKFLVSASIRADGSSRFGQNHKYGYFPSFALAWKLAEEDFIPAVFDDLKLRVSWGQTGNQGIGNYASLSTYRPAGNALLGGSPLVGTEPSRVANPDLKWETTSQFNAGLDAAILNGRVSGTLDFFIKDTRDMLINLPLPRSSGFASILENVGSMKNQGIELLINSSNITGGEFTWGTSLNFSAIRNEVKDIGTLESIITGNVQAVGNTTIIHPGSPLNAYYGYYITGIFASQEEVDRSAQPNARPGYPVFQDTNGDKAITPNDQVMLGNPFPDFIFGLNNTFSYKNLTLDIFIQGQSGAELLNINAIESMYPANSRRNRIARQILDRWTPDNPGARWPSGVQPSSYGAGKVSNLVVEDASYVRLKSLRLGYTFPLRNQGVFRSATVYLIGQNLFTITDYTGFDPEANAFGRSNLRIDYNAYPMAKTWLLGVNVGF